MENTTMTKPQWLLDAENRVEYEENLKLAEPWDADASNLTQRRNRNHWIHDAIRSHFLLERCLKPESIRKVLNYTPDQLTNEYFNLYGLHTNN
jgi:hypothetical protein